MPQTQGTWWISQMVTRTRVTLLGFNLSVVAFMLGLLLATYEEEAFTHHLPAMSSLFVAFALSILSAGSLLASQELDEAGNSRPWLFSVGDVLMYLALSQSVAGFTRKYVSAVDQGVRIIQLDYGAPEGTGSLLVVILAGLGLVAWVLAFYVGPCISIWRSPLVRGQRWGLGVFYLACVAVIVAIATQGHLLQDAVLRDPEPLGSIVLWQLLQPLTW